jgi:pentatricopeptide repeat protein
MLIYEGYIGSFLLIFIVWPFLFVKNFCGILFTYFHQLVDEGRYYFESMSRDHCITPSKDHYSCMIDILGHAGHLEEVEKFIQNMPFEPDAIGWAALLGACRNHSYIELGSRVA